MKHFLLKTWLTMLCLLVGVGYSAAQTFLDFSKIDFKDWTSSYNEYVIKYENVGNVTFTSASKQTTTITDIPVTKGCIVEFVATNGKLISSLKLSCKQWTTKTQTIYLYTSTDGGKKFNDTNIESDEFEIQANDLQNVNAIMFKFSSQSNQIGIASLELNWKEDNSEQQPQKELSSIAVKTSPTKVTYTEGENFDPAGLVITQTFDDSSTEDVTYSSTNASAFTFNPSTTTALQTSNTSVAITYAGKSTSQAITVNEIPSHTVSFSVNGTISSTTDVKEGADITFPDDPDDINGKKFMGWAENTIVGTTNTAPTFVTSGTMGTSDVTYYAVFATSEGSNDYSLVTNASALSAGDVIIIAHTTSGNAATTIGTNNYIGAAAVTFNANNDKITDAQSATEFTLGGNATDGWSFNYSEGSICITGTANNNLASTGEYNLWAISISNNNASITSKKYTSRYLKYNTSTPRFSSYASNTNGTNNPRLFRKNVTYSDYCTTVAAAKTPTSLSWSATAAEATMGAENNTYPTLTTTPADLSGVTYSSSNTSVATINASTGAITLVNDGETTIKASFAGDETHNAAEDATYTLTVNPAPDTRTEVNLSTFTTEGNTTSIVKGAILATTVTNDQAEWTAAYTYASSNGEVATVSETGVITAVAKGTATITVSLNVAADDEAYKAGSTTSKSIEITVTNPTHTATFYANSVQYGEVQNVEEGEAIAFPTGTPDDVNGKTFVGWTATKIVGTQDEAPEYVTRATMGEMDVEFYAVFAVKTPGTGGGSSVDVLTRVTTGIADATTSYTEWNDKSVSDGSNAVYAGNSAGSNNSIQLRSTNSSGIISTTSGGTVSKVSIEWESHTASGRVLDVYGSNDAYSSSADLYDSNAKGTKLGSITYGTSTELAVSGEYKYIGIRSNSGAQYISSITIEWQSGTPDTFSDYCTTVDGRVVESIVVKTVPTKGTYAEGEFFDPTGLVLTATYDNDESEDVDYAGNESKFSFNPALSTALTISDTQVTITYGGKSTTQSITVNELPKYTVTIDNTHDTNGTISVWNGDVELASGDRVLDGTKLTVTCTPDDGYRFYNWQVVGSTYHTFTKNFDYTIAGEDITIRANYEKIPEYTITYYVNGVPTTEEVREGAALNFPTNPTMDGKVFRGWIDQVKVADSSQKPDFVTATTAQGNATFFAVFATETTTESSTGADEWVKVPTTYTHSDFVNENNKYIFVYETAEKSGLVFTGIAGSTNKREVAIENGKIADDIVNPFVYVTMQVQNTTKLAFIVHGGTNDMCYMNDKEGSTGMNFYSQSSTITSTKKGNTISYDSENARWIIKGYDTNLRYGTSTHEFKYYVSTTLESNDYIQIYMKQAGTETTTTYSDFTTNMDVIERDQLKSNHYFTICYPYAVHPKAYAGAKAYNIVGKTMSGDRIATLELEEVNEDTYLTAGMPYFMVGEETTVSTDEVAENQIGKFLGYHSLDNPADAPGNHNGLYGVFSDFAFKNENSGWAENEYYVISSNKVQAGTEKSGVKAYRAYIKKSEVPNYVAPAPNESAARFVIELEEGTLTELDEVELKPIETSIYNLQGQRINRTDKGVYIVNGRKVIR